MVERERIVEREPVVERETTVITSGRSGGGGAVIAVVLLLAVVLILFLLFGGGLGRTSDDLNINVDVKGPVEALPEVDLPAVAPGNSS
ncbi:MAG: hypothetical protein ACK4K7_07335 [Allosphingosinicella sp.]|uniref:hypothetical protein n=1 Tax=Allosphingosinicella sp. TaxID=2823234 RepID=UPI003939AE2B